MSITRRAIIGGLLLSGLFSLFMYLTIPFELIQEYIYFDLLYAFIAFWYGYLFSALTMFIFKKAKENKSVVYYFLGCIIVVLNIFLAVMIVGETLYPMP